MHPLTTLSLLFCDTGSPVVHAGLELPESLADLGLQACITSSSGLWGTGDGFQGVINARQALLTTELH